MKLRILCLSLIVAMAAIDSVLSAAQSQTRSKDKDSTEAARRALASVVRINGEDVNGHAVPSGSGFLFREGLIATDYGLIKDAVLIRVTGPDQQTEIARLVGVDSDFMVAVLQVGGVRTTPLVRAYSMHVKKGDQVYVPASGGGPSVARVREVPAPYYQLRAVPDQAGIGGPVLNELGQVVGIVVSVQDDKHVYAVPASHLAEFGYSPIGGGLGEQGPPDIPGGPPREGFRIATDGVPGGVPGGVVSGSGTENRTSGEPPRIVRKSGGVLQGSAVRRAQPLYPPLAKAARVSGAVVVEVTVTEEGDVMSARPVSGHPLLKDSAVAAARGWKFTPTLLQGEPVKVIGTITFNFSL